MRSSPTRNLENRRVWGARSRRQSRDPGEAPTSNWITGWQAPRTTRRRRTTPRSSPIFTRRGSPCAARAT